MASTVEIAAMRRAIAISAFGLGTTSPNPPVGCVILDADGQMIGEGFHRRKGEAHAEGHALAAAGAASYGGTAVVTLEPCNHAGRAPACRGLLIDAGIARVVVALIDPTSRGEGGVAELRRAGVDVETGVLAGEAELVLGSWLTALGRGIPSVTWAYVQDAAGHRAMPIADLQRFDAVLYPDGGLQEGTPGGHGDTFMLPGQLPAGDPEHVLRTLYASGVRSLLMVGDQRLAAPWVAGGVVDEVVIYLPGRTPSAAAGEPVAPAGFSIAAVRRAGDYMVVQTRRHHR
ncbi:bifunctional diaminohydroxyphosphoribosylaminopyrimidine deaminase/5-amino-6-(5-phosphoribosylamino)uracil reductase RibD [Nonomuraea sp. NPDC003707]